MSDIIINYTETKIKITFDDSKVICCKEFEFNRVTNYSVLHIKVYGFWILVNPRNKFKGSDIESITGNVILIGDASEMFYGAEKFDPDVKEISSIRNWDVSNVIYMDRMFKDAKKFNSNIDNWDVSNVKSMSGMFYRAISFNSDITDWYIGSAKCLTHMFDNATNFDQNLSTWDISEVESIFRMFWEAKKFKGIIKVIDGVWKITYPE